MSVLRQKNYYNGVNYQRQYVDIDVIAPYVIFCGNYNVMLTMPESKYLPLSTPPSNRSIFA